MHLMTHKQNGATAKLVCVCVFISRSSYSAYSNSIYTHILASEISKRHNFIYFFLWTVVVVVVTVTPHLVVM